MAIVASDYDNKVNAYFQATYGREATAAELSTWTNNLLDNQGSVWTGDFQQTLSADKGWGSDPLSQADAETQVDEILANLFDSTTGLDASIATYYVDHLVAGTIKPRGVVNAILNDLGLMPNVAGELSKPAGWGFGPGDGLLTEAQIDTYKENIDFNPEPTPGETFVLTTDTDVFTPDAEVEADRTTDGDDTVEGIVSGLASTGTLNAGDQIDGGKGTDTLDIDMSSNFSGFTGDGYMKNVEVLDAANTSTLSRTFDATGVTGLETIKIDANDQNFKVQDLANAELAVEVSNADGDNTIEIAYDTDVTKGSSDSITFTLNNVGEAKTSSVAQKTLDLKSTGIESLNIVSSGTANYVDASNVDKATEITVAGAADLKLDDVAATVTEFDGAGATGDLTVDLTSVTSLESANAGAGDDVITVDEFGATATFAGGDGDDKLVLKGTATVAASNYKPGITGFETLEINGLDNNVVIAADNVTDIAAINVLNDMGKDLTVANSSATAMTLNLIDTNATADVSNDTLTHTAAADFTVNVSSKKTTAGIAQTDDLVLTKAGAVTLNVENYSDYQGDITAAEAQTFTVNVAKGGNVTTGIHTVAKAESVVLDVTKGGVLTSEIIADTADTVEITTGDAQTVKLDAKAATSMVIDAGGLLTFAVNTAGNDFDALSSLTVTGTGGVAAGALALGKNASAVTVDASESTGAVTVDVAGYSGTGGAAEILGSDIGANTITIGADRNEVNVTGGINNDTVTYNTDFSAANTEGNITIDLGTTSTGDTLNLFAGNNDLTSATVSLTGVDIIDAGAGGNNLTMNAADISGQDIALGGVNTFATVTLKGTSSADTIDLADIDASTLTVNLVVEGSVGKDTITASNGADVFSYTAETQLGDTIKSFGTGAKTDSIKLDVGGSKAATGGKIFSDAAKTASNAKSLLLLGTGFGAGKSGALTASDWFNTAKTYASATAFISALNAFSVAGAATSAAKAAASNTFVAFGLGASGTVWAAMIESANITAAATTSIATPTKSDINVNGVTANDVTIVGTANGIGATDIVLV